ncbi:MAG TPA: hypothetical protein VGJ63_08215 [Micromonosporaceae bacterium]
MLGIGRRKRHAKLARKELNESLDHFMRAATHAAGGMGATVGPKVNAAREYVTPTAGRMRNAASHGWESTVAAFAPVASAARDGARSAGEMAVRAKSRNRRQQEAEMGRKRRSVWAGMLAAGAAVGAAGALIMRRRKQRWEEYDPAQALEAMRDDADPMIDSTRESVDRAADTGASAVGKASTMAESAKDQASSTAGTVKERASSTAETAKRQKDKATDQTEDLISRSTPSRNTGS